MAKATTSKTRSTRKKSTTSRSSAAAEAPPETPASEVEVPEEGAETTDRPTVDNDSPIDAETHAKYEEIKRGEIHITELQRMTVQELHDVAKKEGLEDYSGLKKQDLVFKVLKDRINRNGLMYGEGVLEILPDGFGFLRSPE